MLTGHTLNDAPILGQKETQSMIAPTIKERIANISDSQPAPSRLPIAELSARSTRLKEALTKSGYASPVAYPGTPAFIIDAFPYNKRLPIIPAAIAYPSSVQDVVAAVKAAATAGVHVQPRCGGHSYGAFSYGGVDGQLVIDLTKSFGTVSVQDRPPFNATIGGGCKLGVVTAALAASKSNPRIIPHGTCPQVGVGGHCTIGGLGPPSRQYGMMLDNIVSFDIVLADGTFVENVSASGAYQDLFWAVRGAGASFGVITKFVFMTYPEPAKTMHWSFQSNVGTPAQLTDAYMKFQDWAATDPDPKIACLVTYTSGILLVERTFFGDHSEFQAKEQADSLGLGDIHLSIPGSSRTDWIGQVGSGTDSLGQTLAGGIPAAFYAKTLILDKGQLLTKDAARKLFDYAEKNKPSGALWFVLFDMQGGRTNSPELRNSAFAHRDGIIHVQFYAVDFNAFDGAFGKKIYRFIQGLSQTVKDAMGPDFKEHCYPGYVDPDLIDYPEAYWRDNYARLQEIKQKYDSSDLFSNPQSVRPKSEGSGTNPPSNGQANGHKQQGGESHPRRTTLEWLKKLLCMG